MKLTGATKEFTNASNRPWTLYTKFSTLREPYQIQDADGVTVAVVLHNPMTMEDGEAEDNARLLLAAVNERERLRAAIDDAIDKLERASLVQDHSVHIVKQACRFVAKDLRAALDETTTQRSEL